MQIISNGVIMFKNTPVISFDLDSGRVNVLNTEWLPFSLSEKQTVEAISDFLMDRLPVKHRQDYKEICALAGISPFDTVTWQRRTHCLHVNDDYWIRREDENVRWEDIDPRAQ